MRNYLFELKEGLLISLRAIRVNKIRSVLTTLGIVIGVAAVVLMSTAIKGIDKSFREGFSSFGANNLYIDKWAWFNNETPWWELRNRRNITMEEYYKFRDMVDLPAAVAPTLWTNQNVVYKDRSLELIQVIGTTNNYIKTTNLSFSQGRFFTELESNGGRLVTVIGSSVADKLFPQGNAIDNKIEVKGRKFRVVGVLEEMGSTMMGDFNPDNQTFVPMEALFKYMVNKNFRSITINVKAPSSEMVDNVKQEAIGVMRRVRGLSFDEDNDFSINQQEALLEQINSTVGVIQTAGLFITGLALLVGAIGIMNIMFVSVKERTKEIGIRKAIGAKRRTILGQFISESAIICLLGGLLGLIIAIIGGMVIRQFDFPVSIQIDAFILAFSISLLTGVISGFAPAYSAAKLDPVEALRYE
jgi:putative ABC transport system permease protein